MQTSPSWQAAQASPAEHSSAASSRDHNAARPALWGPSRRTGWPWRLDNGAARSHVRTVNAYYVKPSERGTRSRPNLNITKQSHIWPPGGRRPAGPRVLRRTVRDDTLPPLSQPPGRFVHYISTRDGRSPPERLGFDEMLLAGLARDGGLYVPAQWPRFDADQVRALAGRSYAEIAVAVIAPFIGETIDAAALRRLVDAAYAGFGHAAVAPLKQLAPDLWLLELFHGPTLAFKDYALQLVGRLFDHVLAQRGERVTIIGATSGDTGSAAIEACRDPPPPDAVILSPPGPTPPAPPPAMTPVPRPHAP